MLYLEDVKMVNFSVAMAVNFWMAIYILIHIGVPFGLDGVWHLYFVSGIFSAITSIIIVRRAKITGNPRRLKKANGN